MKKNILFLAICIILCNTTFSQISGNQAYSQNNSQSLQSKKESEYISAKTTDSTIIISSRVLLSLKPDYCIVTIGLNQESQTLSVCLDELNKRIKNITTKIGNIGVKKEDYYVDFISQTKIYDYNVDEKKSVAEEYYKGLEVKKNLIIKINDLNNFDKLVEIAAEYDVYDIVKVDYRNTSLETIYNKLFIECNEIIEKKKTLYFEDKTNVKKTGVVFDNFYSIPPNGRYNSYQAYETSNFIVSTSSYSRDFYKKELRKGKTFYYNGIDPSGFDKVMNMEVTTVGIQYILELSIKYNLK